jgi:hypothetical protein
MKRLVILIGFLALVIGARAQSMYFDDTKLDLSLMNGTWDLIAQKKIKKITPTKEIAVFPARLNALNNKSVDLSGYMVPIKAGMTHTTFMLAVLPFAQCNFCGTAGIPDMVEVHLQKPIRYTDDPITIVGKLKLNTQNILTPNVLLVEASEYK